MVLLFLCASLPAQACLLLTPICRVIGALGWQKVLHAVTKRGRRFGCSLSAPGSS